MVKDHSDSEREREMFYLTTHSTHFIYGYMVSDIWLSTILIARNETRCHHIGYSFRLTARVLLYAPSHRDRIAHTTAIVTQVVVHWLEREIAQWVHPMKDRSDDSSHHERTLLPQSYISYMWSSVYLFQKYGIEQVVKGYSNNTRVNLLLLLFPIGSKGSFIWTISQNSIHYFCLKRPIRLCLVLRYDFWL